MIELKGHLEESEYNQKEYKMKYEKATQFLAKKEKEANDSTGELEKT
jgi:hypothetical protein